MQPPSMPKTMPTVGAIDVDCSGVRKSVPASMPAPDPTSAHVITSSEAARGSPQCTPNTTAPTSTIRSDCASAMHR